jgi:hypothetical protein
VAIGTVLLVPGGGQWRRAGANFHIPAICGDNWVWWFGCDVTFIDVVAIVGSHSMRFARYSG